MEIRGTFIIIRVGTQIYVSIAKTVFPIFVKLITTIRLLLFKKYIFAIVREKTTTYKINYF